MERSLSAPALERIGDRTDVLGESAVWCEREGALYWVDIRAPALRRWKSQSGQTMTWPMPDLIGAVALCERDRVLVALRSSIAFFDLATGTFEAVAAPEAGHPDMRCNDGRCDRQGRFWVGTMQNLTRAPEGKLYRLDRRHRCIEQTSGIRIPNSLAWSPDSRTMYFADSLLYTIFAYDFDADSGEAGERRVFAETTPPAIPDGSAVDAEGFLWNAQFDGWRIARYAPSGKLDRVVELPVQRPTSCTFGGPNLDTLYITTATQQLTAEQIATQPLAGALLALDVGVRGLPEPRYQG